MPTAQVKCSGISYFVRVPIMADGEPVMDPSNGRPLVSVERHMAKMGDIVQLTQEEFDLHSSLGGVQVPDSAPLPGAPGSKPTATPFGVPVVDGEGNSVAWDGPIAPEGSPITQDYLEALAAQAAGNTGEEKEVTEIDLQEATVDQIREFIADNKLNAADTVDLAGGDPEFATKVLEAEEAGASRVTVVEPLMKLIDAETSS